MTLSKDQQIRDQAASVKPASDVDVLLRNAVIRQLERLCEKPLAPALYLVATPIGNLGDITLRALATLFRADVVACEDTRHSQKLLAAYSLKKKTIAYHDFSTEADRAHIAGLIAGGSSVALISDAGTPLVSDPGYKLVQEILARGGEVFAIPGASAVLTAL